jgi:short-subunit dehydrogenase
MKRTHLLQTLAGITAATAACAVAAAQRRQKGHRRTEDRVVLITGGSRGLGYALAERFAREGNRLVLLARGLEELNQARLTLLKKGAVLSSNDVLVIPADLKDEAQAKRSVEHAIEHFGRIDVLINNAGVIEVGPIEDLSVEAFRSSMVTNFFAALYVTHAALPHMLQRNRTRPAAIVNICSIGGKVAVPHLLPYTASKFALVGFSEGLHAELRHKGIRVTTVCPGLMRTGGHVHAKFAGNRKKEELWFNLGATTPIVAASVRRAANHIYNAVARGRAEITITPQAWFAARATGLAPEMVQRLTSFANEFVLPAPIPATSQSTTPVEQIKDNEREGAAPTTVPWASSPASAPTM